MTKMLNAARLHTIGEPFQVDTIPVPDIQRTDGFTNGGQDSMEINRYTTDSSSLVEHGVRYSCNEVHPHRRAA